MKIFLILFSPLIFITGCSNQTELTAEQKADTLIRHYLDSTLDDPRSYEAVKFEKMDTVMTDYRDDPGYYELPVFGSSQAITDMGNNFQDYELKDSQGYYDHMDKLRQLAIDSLAMIHKPKVKWYRIVHTFRARNSYNALVLHTMEFNIDTGLNQVLRTKNLKD